MPLRHAILLTAGFTLLLWLLHIVDAQLLPADIKPGVYPRRAAGLIGIPLAPLVHGSFGHLISNTLPLLMLGSGLLCFYPRAARLALPLLYLAPGVGVWLFARDAYHIGASGLTYGLMFFLLFIGLLRKDRASAGFSAVILFLYSGMLAGLLPEDSDISFEYHLFGALTGAASAFALRARDPQLPAEKYDWEYDQRDELDDPIIGDQWRMTDDSTADADAPPPDPDDPDALYTMDAEDALLDAEWYEGAAEEEEAESWPPEPGELGGESRLRRGRRHQPRRRWRRR
ncbi:MAG: rhomboid family intramembrane serine protease [Gammaproteobacteria bacterium]|nr:rhomboid family intramembrane serine protease [Gammaproteobacteria bacterium]